MDIKTAMLKVAVRKDGVDHIWISPFGATQVGKFTSFKWRKKFFIPQLGEFITTDAFVAWLFTRDENMRQNPAAKLPHLSNENFKLARKAMFFAKYHQLAALKPALIKECGVAIGEKSVLDIPWIEYKQHMSGIKEYNPNPKRALICKEMVKHLLANGAKTPFACKDFDYQSVYAEIMSYVKEKFNLEDPECTSEDFDKKLSPASTEEANNEEADSSAELTQTVTDEELPDVNIQVTE